MPPPGWRLRAASRYLIGLTLVAVVIANLGEPWTPPDDGLQDKRDRHRG